MSCYLEQSIFGTRLVGAASSPSAPAWNSKREFQSFSVASHSYWLLGHERSHFWLTFFSHGGFHFASALRVCCSRKRFKTCPAMDPPKHHEGVTAWRVPSPLQCMLVVMHAGDLAVRENTERREEGGPKNRRSRTRARNNGIL